MQQYTMTFVLDGFLDIPNDPKTAKRLTPAAVMEKMEKREFVLADFNLSNNIEQDYAETYIEDPDLQRSVLEITIGLEPRDLESRDQLFDLCLDALKKNRLSLQSVKEKEQTARNKQQSIINFTDRSIG